MQQVIRPLQISLNTTVIEQSGKFYFSVSATLGIDIVSNVPLLDLFFLKDVFEVLGEGCIPDTGMPKPCGEFLVTGSFFSSEPVTGGEVKVQVGNIQKSLYVFGPRKWTMGLPSKPEKIEFLKIDYEHSFGGEGYDKNPRGMGFKDGLLPLIESPDDLICSPDDIKEPAGFGPLAPELPQRMKYAGTYGADYLKKYFPGYPPDFSWNFFLTAPEDQRIKGFFNGDETFALYNLHPEKKIIKGRLPGYLPRCFINQNSELKELPLHLDTIWFFPEKMLVLTIFRGTCNVQDDEGSEISDIMLAYEEKNKTHDFLYYRSCFEKRKKSHDLLLYNLNTHDLIPETHKSAMEILFSQALNHSSKSEFSKNIDAKFANLEKMVEKEMNSIVSETEKDINNLKLPEEVIDKIPDRSRDIISKDNKIDVKKFLMQKNNVSEDHDLVCLKKDMEAILPGITSGDISDLDMKHFSFEKIDALMERIEIFFNKKQSMVKNEAEKNISDAKEDIYKRISLIKEEKSLAPSEKEKILEKLNETLEYIESIDLDNKAAGPLPRIDSKKIIQEISRIPPHVMSAMEHLKSLKKMGIENEQTKNLEKDIKRILDRNLNEIEERIREAEHDFKASYRLYAHFMERGLSPHKRSLKEVEEEFFELYKRDKNLSNKDFACIDLSNQNLDGINLEGAYLEQVNLSGASLKKANLKNAILARANLTNTDFSEADLTGANIGGVAGENTIFFKATLDEAKLSKSKFFHAVFDFASLKDIETIDVHFYNTSFKNAILPLLQFFNVEIMESCFDNAMLESSTFLKSTIKDSSFNNALLKSVAFVETNLLNVFFEKADISGACFVVTDIDKIKVERLNFSCAKVIQTNFFKMNLKNAIFKEAVVQNSNFMEANMEGSDLSFSEASRAIFRKANLKGANFERANLMEASLAKAYLVGANFLKANLYQTDFLRSVITNTDFKGANLDRTLIENWRPE